MKELRRILVVVLIGMVVSVSGFAQSGGNDNRPPKDPQKVKEKEKPPPPTNNNQNSNRPRKP